MNADQQSAWIAFGDAQEVVAKVMKKLDTANRYASGVHSISVAAAKYVESTESFFGHLAEVFKARERRIAQRWLEDFYKAEGKQAEAAKEARAALKIESEARRVWRLTLDVLDPRRPEYDPTVIRS